MVVVLLASLAAACANDRDTLLQIDVRPPAGLTFSTLHFTIGDGTGNGEVRRYRGAGQDAASDRADTTDAGPTDSAASDTARDATTPTDVRRDAVPAVDAPRDVRPATDVRPASDGPAATPDAGPSDAGPVDAAKSVDAGVPDGGMPDAGASIDVDMILPRRLSGPQPVVVRALDLADCTVATSTVTVTLIPGTRVVVPGPIDLTPLSVRDCAWQPQPDGGGDRAEAAGDVAPAPQPCQSQDQCGAGANCVTGFCAAAPATCAALAGDDPALQDGVYWLAAGGGAAAHAYCDMGTHAVLCADAEGDHTGVTRDATHLHFILRSVLDPTAGNCRVWAVRDTTSAGTPVDELIDHNAAGSPSKTCAALGFKADVSLGKCAYGTDPGFTDCGFGQTSPFYKWSNNCDCGSMPDYFEHEGRVFEGYIPWNFSGTISARCAVR